MKYLMMPLHLINLSRKRLDLADLICLEQSPVLIQNLLSIGLTFTENADLDEIKTTTANTIRTLCKDLGLRSLSELIIQQFLQKSLKIFIP